MKQPLLALIGVLLLAWPVACLSGVISADFPGDASKNVFLATRTEPM